jgi:two-component system LytT family response regulator
MNPIPSVQSALGQRLRPLVEEKARRTASAAPSPLESVENKGAEFVERLLIREDGELRVARLEDVDWIEGDGNYILLHAGEQTYRLRCALGGLAPRLDPRRFVRVHRSAVVNLDRIAALRPRLSGTYDLVLVGGTRLSLARSHRRRILELLGRGA